MAGERPGQHPNESHTSESATPQERLAQLRAQQETARRAYQDKDNEYRSRWGGYGEFSNMSPGDLGISLEEQAEWNEAKQERQRLWNEYQGAASAADAYEHGTPQPENLTQQQPSRQEATRPLEPMEEPSAGSTRETATPITEPAATESETPHSVPPAPDPDRRGTAFFDDLFLETPEQERERLAQEQRRTAGGNQNTETAAGRGEKLVVTLDEVKNIITSQLEGHATINNLELIGHDDELELRAELDAGLLGGRISIRGAIVNKDNEITVGVFTVEARGYVKTRIGDNLSHFSSTIKTYLETKYEKEISSIQIVNNGLEITFAESPAASAAEPDAEHAPGLESITPEAVTVEQKFQQLLYTPHYEIGLNMVV